MHTRLADVHHLYIEDHAASEMTRFLDEVAVLKPADPAVHDDDLEEFTLSQAEIFAQDETRLENLLNAHDKNMLILKGRLERPPARKQDLCRGRTPETFSTMLTYSC